MANTDILFYEREPVVAVLFEKTVIHDAYILSASRELNCVTRKESINLKKCTLEQLLYDQENQSIYMTRVILKTVVTMPRHRDQLTAADMFKLTGKCLRQNFQRQTGRSIDKPAFNDTNLEPADIVEDGDEIYPMWYSGSMNITEDFEIVGGPFPTTKLVHT